MTTVRELLPGDEVYLEGIRFGHCGLIGGLFVARAPHPDYPGLQLVVWRLSNNTWSFDALLLDQYIGEVVPARGTDRGIKLRAVLETLK